jgi:pimeloyl-ACP methyl ester carboxylesterase
MTFGAIQMTALASNASDLAVEEWCSVYGDIVGRGNVVILGPVNPVWHGSDFCRPLLELLLSRRKTVFVVDSLHLLSEERDAAAIDSSLRNLADFIRNQLPHPELIAGYALGGSLAMRLTEYLPEVPRVLSLSGPGFIDPPLRRHLSALLQHLDAGDLQACLHLLARLVAPAGSIPEAAHQDSISAQHLQQGLSRMRKGFRFLLELDARPALKAFAGRVLCMLGQLSQLATMENLATQGASDARQVTQVPRAGMRVMLDNREFTLSNLSEWMEKDDK